MQMSIRSLDENGVRKVFDPNESERKLLIDNLWFERRDESTLDEKTHDPKFHKELLALFKETETIKAERTNTTVFPIAAIATDAKLDMASLTLTLLMVMARGLAKQNEIEPSYTYQTWHKALRETLNQVALRLEIPFHVLLYNISTFWLPSFVQAEFNLDNQQIRLYAEAMQQATMSGILANSMAVGMHVVYRGPSGILQKLIFDKGNLPLFSYLVYAQNQKNWLQAILGDLDPAGPLRLKKQLELNIEAILTWIYSTWVNVAGIMHPLDENPAINRESTPWFLVSLTNGHSHVGGNRGLNTSNSSHSIANLWRGHGTKIPDPSLTYGSEYSHLLHTTLCNNRWNPTGAHLPQSSSQLQFPATAHGLHDHQRQKAGRTQLHVYYKSTCAMRPPDANGIPPNCMATYPSEPSDRSSTFPCRLEHRSDLKDLSHCDPEIRRQKARRKPHRVAVSLRM